VPVPAYDIVTGAVKPDTYGGTTPVIPPPKTTTDVAGMELKDKVFVVHAKVKLPPDNVNDVPPLRGPFIGRIEFKRPPAIVNNWASKHSKIIPRHKEFRTSDRVTTCLCCRGLEAM
jgi:hypothetical protein